jgi:hypothetical protein
MTMRRWSAQPNVGQISLISAWGWVAAKGREFPINRDRAALVSAAMFRVRNVSKEIALVVGESGVHYCPTVTA